MTEKKQGLKDVLNIRVDEALAREVERIAQVQGTSASEIARQLIRHGVEVERQAQASLLALPYEWDTSKMRGRVVIDAKWVPYTRREVLEADSLDLDEIDERTVWFEGDTP
jgi:predicted transcriptional regulator